jgi:predicted sulfurtransferase
MRIMKSNTVLIFLLIIMLPIIASCQSKTKDKEAVFKKNLSVAEFEEKLKEPDVILLDTRTSSEFQAGHLEGARLIDLGRPGVIEQLNSMDKTKTYVLYCTVGGRSEQIKNKMYELGFTHVAHLKGGIQSWQSEGKKVIR